MKNTQRQDISTGRRIFGSSLLLLVVAALSLTVVMQSVWGRSLGWSDQLDLIVDVRKELVDSYVTEPDQQAMAQAAVRGMVESIDDPYTTYLSPEDLKPFERTIHGQFTGIGAEVDKANGRLRIVSPLEDSPAWEAGVLPGDIVLEVEGKDTKGLKLTDAVDILTGKKGTDVSITVRHPSGEQEQITITREVIKVHTVRGFDRDKDQHFEYMLDRDKKIGYARLTQFNERTTGELKKALKRLKDQGVNAFILDLRFNPGGLLTAAVGVSDLFLAQGKTIVSVKGRTVPERTKKSRDKPMLSPEVPMIVLANQASASAAEIVTGAMKDNDRALIVGTRTFGKGSVQQVKMLSPSEGALKITNAYYYIPSGRKIHRTEDAKRWGVDPTDGSWVPMTPEELEQMVKVRRNVSIDNPYIGEQGKRVDVTPQWIREQLNDPQLAAALEAARAKLKTGKFPEVGQSNKQALILARKRANLENQQQVLQDRLDEIQDELSGLGGEEASKASQADTDGPMDLLRNFETSPPGS